MSKSTPKGPVGPIGPTNPIKPPARLREQAYAEGQMAHTLTADGYLEKMAGVMYPSANKKK